MATDVVGEAAMKTATLPDRKKKTRKALPVPLHVSSTVEAVGASRWGEFVPDHPVAEPTPAIPQGWQPVKLAQVRAEHIEHMLEYCCGNRVRAAEMLGIGRTSLYRFLKRQARKKAAGNGQ